MCGYELYVSEDLYDEYYDAIIRHTSSEGQGPSAGERPQEQIMEKADGGSQNKVESE